MSARSLMSPNLIYPDDNGEPMSENTLQFQWIVTIQGNLDDLFRDRDDVFVAGDHLIYAVEGDPTIRQAPDIYVVFGRPKGHRGSYKVFAEEHVFPQVIFEVWSPSNTAERMETKRQFYEQYGAEEYYIIYPEFPAFIEVWQRQDERLTRVFDEENWLSPRLNIRFEVKKGELTIYRGDGLPFMTFLEMAERASVNQQRAIEASQAARAAESRAEAEAEKAEAERKRAEAERVRAERLAARLRELGIDPDAS